MSIAERQDEVIVAADHPEKYGVSFFANILEAEDDPLCKWHAVKAIGDLKGYEAQRQLLQVLQDPDHEFDESSLHRICAWAIGRVGSALSADVIKLLRSPVSQQTRIALIDALGEIADPVAIPVLSEQLASGIRSVRLWAALSLAKIGEPSLPVLKSALKDADAELVLIIADALSIIATEKTVPVLLDALDKDPQAVAEYFAKGPPGRTRTYIALLRQWRVSRDSVALRDLLDRCRP
ncbi:MAG: HEAT repeat domain-containing protein [Planctomycetes bacterium]|nr:HEAT repeat domain-containing protein [Planctomycetota bacterium]